MKRRRGGGRGGRVGGGCFLPPQPVSSCVWHLFKKGSFVFKKSSCLPHYLLSAM